MSTKAVKAKLPASHTVEIRGFNEMDRIHLVYKMPQYYTFLLPKVGVLVTYLVD